MKTFLRFAWPVALAAAAEFGIIAFMLSHGRDPKSIKWWSVWISLGAMAGLQALDYWQKRKEATTAEKQAMFDRLTKAVEEKRRGGGSTEEPPRE